MHHLERVSWRYLATEAGLFLLLSYLVLFGATFNGVVLFQFNQVNAILVACLGAAWLGWRFWRARPFPATPLDKSLLAVAAVVAVVTFTSTDPRRSAITLTQLFFYILLFYVVVDLLRAGLSAELLIKVWLLSSLILIAFDVLQVGLWYKSWIDLAGWRHPIPGATLRISAFLGHPNFMAAYLNLLLPLGIIRALQSGSRSGRTGWSVWVVVVLILVFFTSSRGGWFGTAAASGILAVLWASQKQSALKKWLTWLGAHKVWVAALALFAVVAAAGGFAVLSWQSKNATHAGSGLDFISRAYIWNVAWNMFTTHPLFGNGPFTFGTQFIQSISVPPSLLLAHSHNFIFNVGAEAGILGVAAYVWVIILFLIAGRKNWRAAGDQERLVFAGLFASLGGLGVHSLFDTPELLPLIGIMIVNFTALVITTREQPSISIDQNQKCVTHLAWNVGLGAAWLALVGLLGWAVWAYQPAAQGVAAANAGDWAQAANGFEMAAARDPRLAFNWLQAGFVRGELALGPDGSLKDARNLSLAIADYRRGLALEPVYATNWANLALLEWANGSPAEAVADIKKASTTAHDQAAFLLTYGRMLEATQQTDEAKLVYYQALNISPAGAETYFFRTTPFRLQVVKAWVVDTKQPESKTADAMPAPGVIQLAGFGLADNGSVAMNQLAQGQSLSSQGNLAAAVEAFQAGLALLEQTTSFGIGQMDTPQYGWYIFNRESIAADLLPGLDDPIYTDNVVKQMLILAEDYTKLGNPAAARQVYQKILRVAPDNQTALDRTK